MQARQNSLSYVSDPQSLVCKPAKIVKVTSQIRCLCSATMLNFHNHLPDMLAMVHTCVISLPLYKITFISTLYFLGILILYLQSVKIADPLILPQNNLINDDSLLCSKEVKSTFYTKNFLLH